MGLATFWATFLQTHLVALNATNEMLLWIGCKQERRVARFFGVEYTNPGKIYQFITKYTKWP
jgi:hypothetical protein